MAETIDGDCTSAAVILSRSTQHAANAAGAMAAAEIRSAPTRSLRRRDGLIQFARDETSQNGEDGVIAAIFACLDKRQRPKTRWCVDVGAWDGVHLSNTHTLLTAGGWRGALLEADAERCAKLRALHAPLGNVAIEAFVSCVDASRSVESLLRKHAKSVPLGVDLVSVDVDGCDYWIFKDLLESGYGSRVYVVEFNPTMPHDVVYIQPRADAAREGSSLAALVELAKKHGYHLAETTLFNAFFVDGPARGALVADGLLRPDDDIDSLHEVTMGTALYQLYDGALKLHGCKKFLWHRRPIDEARLQQIEGRDFPFKPNGDKAKKPAKKRHKSKVTAKAAKGGRAKAAPREPALVAAAAALGLAAALLVARARRA